MNSEKFFNHIISACVNIGLPVNRGRGVNIGCDMFLAICKPRRWNWNWN